MKIISTRLKLSRNAIGLITLALLTILTGCGEPQSTAPAPKENEPATEEVGKAEELRGVVKDVTSEAADLAGSVAADVKQGATEVGKEAAATLKKAGDKVGEKAAEAKELVEDRFKNPEQLNPEEAKD